MKMKSDPIGKTAYKPMIYIYVTERQSGGQLVKKLQLQYDIEYNLQSEHKGMASCIQYPHAGLLMSGSHSPILICSYWMSLRLL